MSYQLTIQGQQLTDPTLALEAVIKKPHLYSYLNSQLKANRALAEASLKQGSNALLELPYQLQCDREVVLMAVKSGCHIQTVRAEFLADREIMLAAVNYEAEALKYASPELQADPELILTATKVRADLIGLDSIRIKLRSDRALALAVTRANGQTLKYLEISLPGYYQDREFVLAAIQEDGGALYWAKAAFKDDRELVLIAIQQSGNALRDASERLQGDRELVKLALERGGSYLPKAFRNDKELALLVVQRNSYLLAGLTPELRGDWAIILAATKQNPACLAYLPDSLTGPVRLRITSTYPGLQVNLEEKLAAYLIYHRALPSQALSFTVNWHLRELANNQLKRAFSLTGRSTVFSTLNWAGDRLTDLVINFSD